MKYQCRACGGELRIDINGILPISEVESLTKVNEATDISIRCNQCGVSDCDTGYYIIAGIETWPWLIHECDKQES